MSLKAVHHAEIFNSDMLVLGRDARGLTQSDLSEIMGVGQGTLSKVETKMLPATDDFVATAVEALGYPREFFFEGGRPYGMPPFHYRRRKKLSAKALGKIVAEMNIRRLHLGKMMRSFDRKANGFIPEFDRDEYQAGRKAPLTPDEAARVVREMWMLPRGPIQNMVDLLEANGGIVIPCNFGTDLIDAMSQRIDGYPVLFFVNINAPADRLRHTLAHELGHMVLHTINVKDDDLMEDEADAFAGAFLLPADEIRPQLRSFDLRQLANLKLYWKVSMAAIAVRADRLKLITPYQSKMFWIEMSRLGYRKREPNEPPKEHPSLLRQMIAFHTKKLGYTVAEMARLLCLLPAEFQSMYEAEIEGNHQLKPSLRLIK